MKKLNPTITKIDAQIEQLTVSLRQPAQTPRPQWLQGDSLTQQRMINSAVGKIIATQLAQDPKLAIANVPPTQQKALFRALAQYTKLVTAQVIQTLKPTTSATNDEANKKNSLNKKITAAKMLLATLMAALYESHAQYYRKKTRKILQRLANLEKKKKQEEMLAMLTMQEQKPEPVPLVQPPKPKPILIPIATPTPEPKQAADHELFEHLQALGLTLGADHKAIEAAFNKFVLEYTAKQNHTPEEKAEFALVQKAYDVLIETPEEILADLPKIQPEEILEFANAFKAQMPDMLSEGKAVSLESLKAVFIEGVIQRNPENELADKSGQMQKLQLTIAKLENQFRGDPKQVFTLREKFLKPEDQAQAQSRSQLTPTLTPRSPKGF